MEAWKEEMYLAHHGIRGQKWGVRRFQNDDGSLKPAGEKRYGDGPVDKKAAKISAKYDKKLRRSQKSDQQIMDARSKNREKISSKYDKKLNKLKADRDSFKPIKNGLKDKNGRDILTKDDVSKSVAALNDQIAKLNDKKKAKIKDFDDGTKYLKQGQAHYNKVLSDMKNVKLSALNDKSFKKSKEYKHAVASYVNQLLGDMNYYSVGTKMLYARDYANKASNPNYRNRAIATFRD